MDPTTTVKRLNHEHRLLIWNNTFLFFSTKRNGRMRPGSCIPPPLWEVLIQTVDKQQRNSGTLKMASPPTVPTYSVLGSAILALQSQKKLPGLQPLIETAVVLSTVLLFSNYITVNYIILTHISFSWIHFLNINRPNRRKMHGRSKLRVGGRERERHTSP